MSLGWQTLEPVYKSFADDLKSIEEECGENEIKFLRLPCDHGDRWPMYVEEFHVHGNAYKISWCEWCLYKYKKFQHAGSRIRILVDALNVIYKWGLVNSRDLTPLLRDHYGSWNSDSPYDYPTDWGNLPIAYQGTNTAYWSLRDIAPYLPPVPRCICGKKRSKWKTGAVVTTRLGYKVCSRLCMYKVHREWNAIQKIKQSATLAKTALKQKRLSQRVCVPAQT